MFDRESGLQLPLAGADLLFDVSHGTVLSSIMEKVKRYIDVPTQDQLKSRDFGLGERFLNKTMREDLSTSYIRTATSWMSKDLMIGGEEMSDEGGNREKQFTPAIVHWPSDPEHKPYPNNGFSRLYILQPTPSRQSRPGTS